MIKRSKAVLLVMLVGMGSAQIAHAGQAQRYCTSAPLLAPLPAEQARLLPGGARIVPASYSKSDPETKICPDGSVIPITETCPIPPPPAPPPPPPPPPPAAEMGGSDSIVVTGTRMRGEGRSSTADASETSVSDTSHPHRGHGARPRPGLLTAGDHDDLLNPDHYAYYVRNAQQGLDGRVKDLPKLDTRNILTVELVDGRGRPMALQTVSVECSDGNSIDLTSQADGKVVFFPGLDNLSDTVTLKVGGEERRVGVKGSAGQTQRFKLGGDATKATKMDLMIALDATGSMGDEIRFLQTELRAILDRLVQRHPELDLRVGLVAYRDIGDEFVTRTYNLTSDLQSLQGSLAKQSGNGGGDMPEAMDQALMRAVDQDWRDDAIKSMLLVADAPPHDDKMALSFEVARVARAKRIMITPVASSGVDDRAEYFMRSAAAMTQSRYVFLTDDSGIGNPHAEPEIACYVVTSLESTIRRVLDSQLSGRRIEPRDEEIIRTNGQYDNGTCSLPAKARRQLK